MSDTPEIFDATPPTLDHVIGQKRAVQQIRTALDAHFNDRAASGDQAALPHMLLVGPPGVGKSLLSGIVARELGTELHEELAQNILSPGHLHGLMMLVEPGGVIFVDEIHDLPPLVQNTMLRCLEERRLFLGGDRKSITLPPFTFIGATTDEWSLNKPLLQRFKLVARLEHYEEVEIAELVRQRTKRLRWPIDDEVVQGIASRARGVPRLALRLLDAVRRTSRAEDASTITVRHLERMCEVEGVDQLGLDCLERRYLNLLKEAQTPMRLNVLATRLALPRKTIEAVIENELIRLGLVTKTDEGRMLTAAGVSHLAQTVSRGV